MLGIYVQHKTYNVRALFVQYLCSTTDYRVFENQTKKKKALKLCKYPLF